MEYDKNASYIMNPQLVRIGNQCFRNMSSDKSGGTIVDLTSDVEIFSINSTKRSKVAEVSPLTKVKPLIQQRYNNDQLEAEALSSQHIDDTNVEIPLGDEETLVTNKNNELVLRLHVASCFCGIIVGQRSRTKLDIEAETGTVLTIPMPSSKKNINFIEISGPNRFALAAARARVLELVKKARDSRNFSHFISVPLNLNENFRRRFLEFRRTIVEDTSCHLGEPIDESFFQKENKCHLTVRILYLADSHERNQASKLLETFKTKIDARLRVDPIQLHIKGLDIMNDDPARVDVLYAKVRTQSPEHEEIFRQLFNELYDCFEDYGVRENEFYLDAAGNEWKVKVHCTLMNTIMKNRNNNRKRPKIDATKILEKYGDYDFGVVTLNEIHISASSMVNVNNDYYLEIAKIQF